MKAKPGSCQIGGPKSKVTQFESKHFIPRQYSALLPKNFRAISNFFYYLKSCHKTNFYSSLHYYCSSLWSMCLKFQKLSWKSFGAQKLLAKPGMFLARLLGKASPSKATKKLRLPALIALGEVRKTRQYTRENITSVKLPNVWDTIRNIPFMLLLHGRVLQAIWAQEWTWAPI